VPLSTEEQLPPGWKGLNERMFQSLYLIGRLKPGIGVEQAGAEANLLFKQLLLEYSGPQPSAERLQDIQQARAIVSATLRREPTIDFRSSNTPCNK